jgi:hypothetical protein
VFGGGFSIDQVLKSNWELKTFIRRGNKICLTQEDVLHMHSDQRLFHLRSAICSPGTDE